MKKEDSILLNYMYQKGFTEEDMYDESTIKRVRFSWDFLEHRMSIYVKPLFEWMLLAVKKVWGKIKTLMQDISDSASKMDSNKMKIPKVNFKIKNPIKNQVMLNKPRHQVRKIIR